MLYKFRERCAQKRSESTRILRILAQSRDEKFVKTLSAPNSPVNIDQSSHKKCSDPHPEISYVSVRWLLPSLLPTPHFKREKGKREEETKQK